MNFLNTDKTSVAGTITYEKVKNALQGDDLGLLLGVYASFKRFDTQLSSELGKRKLKVAALPVVISSEDKAQDEFLKTLTKKNSFKISLFNAMNALENAFSVFMLNWVSEDEFIFPELKHLNARYFNYDTDTEKLYYTQSGQKTYVDKNKNLFTYYHPTDSGDLIEQSIMHKVVCILSLKQMVISKNILYFDALSVPPIIIKSDKVGDDESTQKIIDQALMLKSAGVAIFDKEDAVELLTGNTDKDSFLNFIKYCDECISKAITGQVLAGNSTQNGTQALGTVHNEIRKDVLAYDAMLLDTGLTPLLKKALELNFADPKPFEFHFDLKTEEDTQTAVQNLKDVKALGFDVPQKEVEETLNIELEKQTTENSLSFNSAQKSLPIDNVDKSLRSGEFKASANRVETDIKAIVSKIVENSSSYEEAYDTLLKHFEDDDFEALEDELGNVISNAYLQGLDE